jgi:hypothetical protein
MQKKQVTEGQELDNRIMKIAEKIKELRIAGGYSSYEFFAWEHNINRVQYWRVEKGANITLKTLLAILDVHQLTLAEFFKDFE